MKTGNIVKLAIVVIILAAIGIYAFNTLKPIAVVASVERGLVVKTAPGTVEVMAEKIQIRSDLKGRIADSVLKVGSEVKKGDILVKLDTRDIELEISSAENNLQSAKLAAEIETPTAVQLTSARLQLENFEADLEFGQRSQAEVDAARREVKRHEDAIQRETLQANLEIDEKRNALEKLKRQKEKMSIISPIDGVVSKVYAYEGDLIAAGQEVAEVVSLTREVKAVIGEEMFADIREGMPVSIQFLGFNNRSSGKVARIIGVADPETQRYPVYIDLDTSDAQLNVGQTGDIVITLDQRENALLVPKRSIQLGSALVVNDGLVSQVQVQTGYEGATQIEVLSGLEEGDLVIVQDMPNFQDGQKVKVVSE